MCSQSHSSKVHSYLLKATIFIEQHQHGINKLHNKIRSTFLTNIKPQWGKQNHTGTNLATFIHTLTYAITLKKCLAL